MHTPNCSYQSTNTVIIITIFELKLLKSFSQDIQVMPIFQAASHDPFCFSFSLGSGIKYSHQSQDEISSGCTFSGSESGWAQVIVMVLDGNMDE